jgi:LPXTG-motif cell wall-anchored protein
MTKVRIIQTLFAVLLLVVMFGAGARADTQFNKRTVITFTQPVEIPGQVLPAGTYTIELYETFSYRHIVRIWNADRTQLIATVLAIPNERLKATEDTVMKFSERPGNAPDALKAWFYPGDTTGQEFVYPKQRAVELAGVTHETIPAVETEPATLQELKSEAIVAETPEKTEIAIGEFIPLTGSDTGTLSPSHPLPQTGSQIPLIALLGALSVSFALVLKRFMS